MATKTIHIKADPAHFNNAMFSSDLLHVDESGVVCKIVAVAPSDTTTEVSFTYITPEQSAKKNKKGTIVAGDLSDYEKRFWHLKEKESKELVSHARQSIAIMATTGLHVYMLYGDDVWKYVKTEVALCGNSASEKALVETMLVGEAIHVKIDNRGNWQMMEKPAGHVYRKETQIPEEIVRHLLVEEILKLL